VRRTLRARRPVCLIDEMRDENGLCRVHCDGLSGLQYARERAIRTQAVPFDRWHPRQHRGRAARREHAVYPTDEKQTVSAIPSSRACVATPPCYSAKGRNGLPIRCARNRFTDQSAPAPSSAVARATAFPCAGNKRRVMGSTHHSRTAVCSRQCNWRTSCSTCVLQCVHAYGSTRV
jgi:hypothetical protein